MEIWEPEPVGKLWATPSLLWGSFTFTLCVYIESAIFHAHAFVNGIGGIGFVAVNIFGNIEKHYLFGSLTYKMVTGGRL
jgi:hypothetical protein